MTECYRCWAEVDLNALRGNLAQIRTLAGRETKILAVVKADAYGHGLRQIAAVLMQSGADVFGVANLAEARAIRAVGQGWPILMLGACLPSEVGWAVRDHVMPTLSSYEEAVRFSAAAVWAKTVVSCHVKVDTGMGRLGALPGQLPELLKAIDQLPGLTVSGLCTHYSSAEEDADFTAGQCRQFTALLGDFTAQGRQFECVHACNSAALLRAPSQPFNMVRVGLLTYGIVSEGACERAATGWNLTPALSWKARVSLVRYLPAGSPISYGHTRVTTALTRVAIITAGYADGYPRAASNRAQVLVGGQFCPVLGRVTMDQMVADVSAVDQVQAGEEVVLLGRQGNEQITANLLARWCQTIPWEVLTNITYRVPRVYRGGHAA